MADAPQSKLHTTHDGLRQRALRTFEHLLIFTSGEASTPSGSSRPARQFCAVSQASRRLTSPPTSDGLNGDGNSSSFDQALADDDGAPSVSFHARALQLRATLLPCSLLPCSASGSARAMSSTSRSVAVGLTAGGVPHGSAPHGRHGPSLGRARRPLADLPRGKERPTSSGRCRTRRRGRCGQSTEESALAPAGPRGKIF
jgi:hypothetical protein